MSSLLLTSVHNFDEHLSKHAERVETSSFLISSDKVLVVFNAINKPLTSVSNDVIIDFFIKDLSENCLQVQTNLKSWKLWGTIQSITSIKLFKAPIVSDTFLGPFSLR